MPQSDRAAVEKQAGEDTRAELKTFIAAFGPAKGAEWFTEGKTFAEAQALHLAALGAENVRLAAEVVRLSALAATNRGEPSPVSFQPEGTGATKEQDLAAKIGPNMARVAGALKFAKK
jgi:hypothetical protein